MLLRSFRSSLTLALSATGAACVVSLEFVGILGRHRMASPAESGSGLRSGDRKMPLAVELPRLRASYLRRGWISVVPVVLTLALALATDPTVAPPVEVFAAQRVAPLALRLPFLTSGSPDSAQDIDGARHGLKVVRVDARTIAAEMVECLAKRNGPDQHLVGRAVGRTVPALEEDAPVPLYQLRRPGPARVLAAAHVSQPIQKRPWFRSFRHERTLTIARQPVNL